MLDILSRLVTWLRTKPNANIVVAYSGGRDSHVLLHALCKLRAEFTFSLSAIHVNHGLQKEAEQWVLHCQKICKNLSVPLQIFSLQLCVPSGMSLESYARTKRYEAFASHLGENAMLVTAHSLSDQAETFLLQMIRGSGLQGLGAIAPLKALGKAKLARPLLDTSRDEIALYAKANKLTWIEDSSNNDLRFRRNYLRKLVLPQLKTLNESIEVCIGRTVGHCQQAQLLLDEYLAQDLQYCLGEKENTLNLQPFLQLSLLKQTHVFRYWLTVNNVMLPSKSKCQDILKQITQARIDSQPSITFGSWQIRRSFGIIFLLPCKKVIPKAQSQKIDWQLTEDLLLPDGSLWKAKITQGKGISLKKLIQPTLQIGYRQGGERCRLQGKKQSRQLKKILYDFKIPSWQRAAMPLFYQADNLVGVGSLFVCDPFAVDSPDEEGWLIENVS